MNEQIRPRVAKMLDHILDNIGDSSRIGEVVELLESTELDFLGKIEVLGYTFGYDHFDIDNYTQDRQIIEQYEHKKRWEMDVCFQCLVGITPPQDEETFEKAKKRIELGSHLRENMNCITDLLIEYHPREWVEFYVNNSPGKLLKTNNLSFEVRVKDHNGNEITIPKAQTFAERITEHMGRDGAQKLIRAALELIEQGPEARLRRHIVPMMEGWGQIYPNIVHEMVGEERHRLLPGIGYLEGLPHQAYLKKIYLECQVYLQGHELDDVNPSPRPKPKI